MNASSRAKLSFPMHLVKRLSVPMSAAMPMSTSCTGRYQCACSDKVWQADLDTEARVSARISNICRTADIDGQAVSNTGRRDDDRLIALLQVYISARCLKPRVS